MTGNLFRNIQPYSSSLRILFSPFKGLLTFIKSGEEHRNSDKDKHSHHALKIIKINQRKNRNKKQQKH